MPDWVAILIFSLSAFLLAGIYEVIGERVKPKVLKLILELLSGIIFIIILIWLIWFISR